MTKKGLWAVMFGAIGGISAVVACSSNHSGGITPDPTADGGAGGDDGMAPLTNEGGPHAPGQDAAPTYRDPRAPDGACNPPNIVCSDAGDASYGGCVAVTVDHDNCGMCGAACIGNDSQCLAGKCDCAAVGFDYCAAGCMDVSSDTNNCGRCNNVCDPAQFNACVNSQCVMQ